MTSIKLIELCNRLYPEIQQLYAESGSFPVPVKVDSITRSFLSEHFRIMAQLDRDELPKILAEYTHLDRSLRSILDMPIHIANLLNLEHHPISR